MLLFPLSFCLEYVLERPRSAIHTLCQAIHPFDINTCQSQLGLDLPQRLQPSLATLERLSQTHGTVKSQAALKRWHRQIPDLSATLHAWWVWTIQALGEQTQDADTQQWVLTFILPWVYWHQQAQKTRQPQLKQGYLEAALLAKARLLDDGFTHSHSHAQQQQWIDWAIWVCQVSAHVLCGGGSQWLSI